MDNVITFNCPNCGEQHNVCASFLADEVHMCDCGAGIEVHFHIEIDEIAVSLPVRDK